MNVAARTAAAEEIILVADKQEKVQIMSTCKSSGFLGGE